MKRSIWKNLAQRIKKAAAIVTALSLGLSLAVAQPVEAGTGVSKISIKMPIKGQTNNRVVIPKGEKTTFVVKLTGYSNKPLYQSDCKVVFTSSSKTKATISNPGYKKRIPTYIGRMYR